MAGYMKPSVCHRPRSPKTAARLKPFVLYGVSHTGRRLGEGAYGCVEELRVNGLVCAGKKIYNTLVDTENEGADHMIEKYHNECKLLASLRHPNIVQFLGICFLESQPASTVDLPVLVMEMLQGNLDYLLEHTPNIPFAKKVSILQDVSRGLVYLHGHSPAIIHRDLTARNVLLNSAMVAKIADMGNSRIVNMQPGQLAKSMTRGVPGTAVYMPPEAFELPPKYGPQLDMFSFGHLALFTATQLFPGDLLPSTYQDPLTNQIKGRNEVERRSGYILNLETTACGCPELVALIKQCLDYYPSARPTASDIVDRLQHICSNIHDAYHSMTRLQLENALIQAKRKFQKEELILMQGLEAIESELLFEVKKTNGAVDTQPKTLVSEQYVEIDGLRYNTRLGAVGGNTGEAMILVSVGDEYPADLVVTKRTKNPHLVAKATQMFGSLPLTVPGLHEEAAADLMATASTDMRGPAQTVVQLLLDVPLMQRSKQYYLKKIESFLQNCQEPAAVLRYLGNSEKDTGNWCFKDGKITFQDLFNIYKKTCSDKVFGIKSDCNYSGQWVRECANTLDSLGIPPCGHRARENGAMVKVFASCQPDQEASEPCYSVEGVTIRDDGSIAVSAKQMNTQRSTWFNSTRLVCCRGPDFPCPKTTFQHLTWVDAVEKSMNLQLVQRREGDRDVWYYLLLHRAGDTFYEEFKSEYRRDPLSLKLSDWGYILESGEGTNPPHVLQAKARNWTCITF